MPVSNQVRDWYIERIAEIDPTHKIININTIENLISYTTALRSDESSQRSFTREEFVHALAVCMLNSTYSYPVEKMYHEKHYAHGRKGTLGDEVDLIIFDSDDLPFAIWEFKSAEEYKTDQESDIRLQLFGTAPLVGAPKLLVHATIKHGTPKATFSLICIEYTKYKTYESWLEAGRPHFTDFPSDYKEPDYEPLTKGGKRNLKTDCTQADFRAVAQTLHNEFFSEHPDNILFINLLKCLLAKILDERTRKKGEVYKFQVLLKSGKEESAADLFERVNRELYSPAYQRYIDSSAKEPDEINSKEFPPERVKTVVKLLQDMSVARGAALHGDVIGAFFEEILRDGFKQERGMYFTHDNLVHFMLEAVDVSGLTVKTWKNATHPDNYLPYIIDPACGSGTFLLKAMNIVTDTIQSRKEDLVSNQEAEQFFNSKMSEDRPNAWAESFLYGLDPKFEMAITAKVNMVLHGDGSAHIFKQDAFKPLENLPDNKFRPAGDSTRSVPKSKYQFDVCESFDLVVSNPPFGITLSSDTYSKVSKCFSLGEAIPSEALFLERCFQLLKPNGRLALVVPESLLNTSDATVVRLFLYRMFWLRAIVSLPRNIFIDTPTLTSLLFAQKKQPSEIAKWDMAWDKSLQKAEIKIKSVKNFLSEVANKEDITPQDIQQTVLDFLSPMIDEDMWILKGGKNPTVIRFNLPKGHTVKSAANYYKVLLNYADFRRIVLNWVFGEVVKAHDYEYQVFIVDEIGYKLSKRKERMRPNQLCRFVGVDSNDERPNLHLTSEPVTVAIDTENPKRVLDYIRKQVEWI
jgi:type I restriction enzyme M protein